MKTLLFGLSCLLAFGSWATDHLVGTVEELTTAVGALADNDSILIRETVTPYALSSGLTVTNKKVTIRGVKADGTTPADPAKVVLQGGGAANPFRILNLTGADCAVSDLTFTNAYVTGTSGSGDAGAEAPSGAALHALEAVVVSNCVFACNTNANSGMAACGGALGLGSANALVTRCRFVRNQGARGGAIYFVYARSGARIVGCTFDGNAATESGGAINTRVSGGYLIVRDSYFTNNVAKSGGALSKNISLISNCVFVANRATSGNGGAYASDVARMVRWNVMDCAFSNNTASADGGAAALASNGSGNNDPLLTRNVFFGNIAGGAGGAVHQSGSTMAATNCQFLSNRAGGSGGAVSGGIGALADTTFVENVCRGPQGGAWYVGAQVGLSDAWPKLVTNCSFRSNRVDGAVLGNNSGNPPHAGGGAVFLAASRGMRFVDTDFIGNTTTNTVHATGGVSGNYWMNGGALVAATGVTLDNCRFRGNTAQTYGSAVWATGTNTISHCEFTGNDACHLASFANPNYAGLSCGTVYFGAASLGWQTVTDCVFSNNTIRGTGGASVGIAAGWLRMRDCRIVDNVTTNLDSSSYVTGFGPLAIVGLTAPETGANNLEIDRVEVRGNRTTGRQQTYGAGIMCLAAAAAGFVRNTLIAGNRGNKEKTVKGDGSAGGGVFCDKAGAAFVLENCTIADNEIDSNVATACYLTNTSCSMTNDVICGSLRADGLSLSHCWGDASASLPAGNGNITGTEPGFADQAHGDYHLTSGSACVNAGANAPWMNGATDLDNNPKRGRIAKDANRVDIGCYEFWPNLGLLLLFR